MSSSSSITQLTRESPPVSGSIGDDKWQRFFQSLYSSALEDGLKSDKFTVVGKVNNAVADNTMLDKQLLRWYNGHYVDYTTQSGDIAYGYACAVRRQAGNAFTVGNQIDAICDRGAGSFCFGQAIEAVGLYRFIFPIIGLEATVGCLDDTNTSAKWGFNPVFKNRGDLVTTMPYGVGANLYNYYSIAISISAQPRSSSGEFCGWTRGISFTGDCLDDQTAPAWSATVVYEPGMIVTSGGRAWECITRHLNQVPAVPSAFWVFTTPAAGGLPKAIGIDFVPMSAASMAHMRSAIRFRDFMVFHWESTGAIGTYFDSTNIWQVIVDNAGTNILGVYVAGINAGIVFSAQPEGALGGGAAATLGNIGAVPGPAGAAQTGWWPIVMNGQLRWIPTWT